MIGGGITGLGIARLAARNGYSCALLERQRLHLADRGDRFGCRGGQGAFAFALLARSYNFV